MTDWIVPANPFKYDARSAFANLQRLHWNLGRVRSIENGDHVFIYESKTTKKIILRAKVVNNYVTTNYIDDSAYILSDQKLSRLGPWMELEFEFEIFADLSLSKLKSQGLKGSMQGMRRMPTQISSYINGILDSQSNESNLNTSFSDGKKIKIYTTKYERNLKNRAAAIKYHGLSCEVCGFNFSNVYGDLGEDFIEVHHLRPVSTLEVPKNIDPVEDLAVLCSNCHRMIHRKISGRTTILSIQELKDRIVL